MNKKISFLIMLPFLFSCASENNLSSSSSSSEEIKEKIYITKSEDINLSLADFEQSLMTEFSRNNFGLSFKDYDDKPLFKLSLSSEKEWSAPLSEKRFALVDAKKEYELTISSDDLIWKLNSLDKATSFTSIFGSSRLKAKIIEKKSDYELPFNQGLFTYFSGKEEETGFYFDTSKAALSRSFLGTLFPERTLQERSYLDVTATYSKLNGLFPLNKKSASLISSLRSNAQEKLNNGEASLYTYEDDKLNYLSISLADTEEIKTNLTTYVNDFIPSENQKLKDNLLAFIARIENINGEIIYSYLPIEGKANKVSISLDLKLKEEEKEESSITDISLSMIGSFLEEKDCLFSLPNDLLNREKWPNLEL